MVTVHCYEVHEIPDDPARALQFIGIYLDKNGMKADGLFYIVGKTAAKLNQDKKSLARPYEIIDNWLRSIKHKNGDLVFFCSNLPVVDTYLHNLSE